MGEVLRIDHLTLETGGHILMRDFNLRVDAGEMVCLSGESGCGKTTLLRALLGFVPLKEGGIHVAGYAMSPERVTDIRRMVDYVPQELSAPCERVGELVEMVLGLKTNRRFVYVEERLFAIWEELGLDRELYSHGLAKVSGGQRQRILLSVAALTDKPLLLADEPTAALDEDNARRVNGFLRRLCGQGRAALVVSHDERLAQDCDRVIYL